MSSRPRVGDLIEIAPIPAVLALADAARLRADLDAQGERIPPRLRSALEALLGGAATTETSSGGSETSEPEPTDTGE